MSFLPSYQRSHSGSAEKLSIDKVDVEVRPAFAELLEHMQELPGGRTMEPTPAEIALAFGAFYHWVLHAPRYDEWDPHHASASAREVACVYIAGISSFPVVREAIREQKPTFDAEHELRLARMRALPEQEGWGDCTTRFVIIACRMLAYSVTGELGTSLCEIDISDDIQLLKLGRDITRQALGQAVFRALYPFAKDVLIDF